MRHVRTDARTRRVAIIGTGLMGGSLGLSLRCFTTDFEVVGFDRDPETMNLALELGVCDETASSVGGAARGADIVVIAVPVYELEAVLTEISEARLDPSVTVTDLCSVKRFPVRMGLRLLGDRFVGGHPMAGSEKSGVVASNADLLARATWFLTPTAATSEPALAEVARLVRSVGARPVMTGPETHDRIVASVSHLPYVVSVALLHSVARNRGSAALGVCGRSLRDMTRVASSRADFWLPLLGANRDEVVGSLDDLIVELASVRDGIAHRPAAELRPYLDEARGFSPLAADGSDRPLPGWSRERESPPAPQLPAPFPADAEAVSNGAIAQIVDESMPMLERAAAKRIAMQRNGSPLGPV